ncbi:MAG: amino acid--tRNA ligase-related protein [Candidatus Paceibacterota bacterium]
MTPFYIKNRLLKDDLRIGETRGDFYVPKYNPKKYYKDIATKNYFFALLILRQYIRLVSDYYFGDKLRSTSVDLFMLTPSISSPMGSGSDSEAINIKFGNLEVFLVDSSQFGFEPLLLNNFDKVYCYLPSMRGEDPDKRHINQFFHCELEMVGTLEELKVVIEGYVKILCETILLMENTINKISEDSKQTKKILKKVIASNKFLEIDFEDAINILIKNKKKEYINFEEGGRDITSAGELELMKILKTDIPIWLNNFDRDRVPFYQKPYLKNKTINADLLFPPINDKGFGGEVVGSGQRQDDPEEMYQSLKRQKVSSEPYEWYIDLRRMKNYKMTSGFGIGIERFIAWVLGKEDIKDVIPYPRLKNIKSLP